jgi:hypothetical protein
MFTAPLGMPFPKARNRQLPGGVAHLKRRHDPPRAPMARYATSWSSRALGVVSGGAPTESL